MQHINSFKNFTLQSGGFSTVIEIETDYCIKTVIPDSQFHFL